MDGPIHEQELPGIGYRYDVDTEEGPLSVVIHHSGRRDLYVGSPPVVVTLDDEQARRVGAVLAGAYFRPALAQRIEAVVGGLLIDWVTLGAESKGAGRSIAELEVRRRTRMSIVAILRGDETLISPDPSEVLLAGDRLIVVGRPQDLDGLVREIT